MSLNQFHSVSKWLTVVFGLATTAVFAFAILFAEVHSVQARLIPSPQKTMLWEFIDPEDILEGTSIPANTHVVFHLPEGFRQISREVLLGRKGEETRYWGYCLPQNFDPELTKRRKGLPGKLFLSERERAIRAEKERKKQRIFSFYRLPRKQDLQRQERSPSFIRHQIEIFVPNLLCYIMTETSLPIGLDEDNDTLNTKLERTIGTDPTIPDTDRDGIWDGIEHFTKLNPLIRDSDNDGLIDGLEDKNWNGKVEFGETDPRNKDTDRDELCDGLCRVRLSSGQEFLLGEDLNLNGLVDDKETDPLLQDTDGDGTTDYQAYIKCLMGVSASCIGKQ